MSSSMKVREAREDELDFLIKKAEENLPHSLTIHGALSIGFRRNIYSRSYSKIYIPEDDSLPFFIIITGIIIKNRPNMTLYWNPEEIPREVARELLLSLPHWSWDEPFIIYSGWTPVLLETEKIVTGENSISKKLIFGLGNYGYCYGLGTKFSTPTIPRSEFVLAPLTEKDAELVHKNWIYNCAEDVESIRRNIESLPSMAAYEKILSSEQENKNNNMESFTDKPISWALTRPYGEVGFNFTFPEHRCKGLSGAVTKELVKKLIEDGITPFVNVTGENPASVKAIENIGFIKCSSFGYQYYWFPEMQLSEF
ncbi:Glycine N-acyltransferase-like protein 3 [Armadillidium nasatum]|uniref:Glycine N-acyltransferase-like protein 3 n=1 Tax=Armadillidium nasatum TaxID=96803 RepID=A0A5N5TAE2_9CRUS|nr:Glycine N-acyltransferase-like protein 3 [Armadillidium nasatum]